MLMFTAKTEAAMLALSANQGDQCFRSDLSQLFRLAGNDSTVLGDWSQVKSIGEQILENVVEFLTAALPGVLVCNQRLRPFEQGELPAVNVKLGREVVTYIGEVKRTSQGAQRELHIIARMEAAGKPPQTDSLRVMVVRCLMADRSLGGLAIGIGEFESEWEYEAGSDATNGVLSTDFEVKYATATDDVTVMLG